MRKMLFGAAVAAGFLVSATASAAISVGSLNPTTGALVFVDLTTAANKDLTNNGFYSSLDPNTAYLFYEGVNDSGQDTFLLHFDRAGRVTSVGTVEGSFMFSLGASDTFDNVWATKTELDGSDDLNNGVTYDRCSGLACLFDPAAVFRGLEPPAFPIFGDFVSITPDQNTNNSAPSYTVSYRFTNDGATMDQVRFGFSEGVAVPEPATWALMIGGFALAGASLRRRRALAFV